MPAAKKPFTSALTYGLTAAEAVSWELAEHTLVDERALLIHAHAVIVRAQLLADMRRAARGVHANIVEVRCGRRHLGQVQVTP